LEIIAVAHIKRITAEIAKAVSFCQQIGITLQLVSEERESFLAGVWIEDGIVYCNPANLKMIGDLLHELGHFAVTPLIYRGKLNSNLEFKPDLLPMLLPNGEENPDHRNAIDGCEQATIAWSYAAALEIDIDVESMHNGLQMNFDELVFDGEWPAMCKSLAIGTHPGIECLINTKMTTKYKWPQMHKWVQD
jgi:hypothetical protein